MPLPVLPPTSRIRKTPWYLIGVSGAILLAAVRLREFFRTGEFAEAVIALACICVALIWLVKPVIQDSRAKTSDSFKVAPLRSRLSPNVLSYLQWACYLFVLAGLILKFGVAA